MSNISAELARKSLRRFAASFDSCLTEHLPNSIGAEGQVIAAMEYALKAGGKRLRPFLAKASADLFSIDPATSDRVAAAIEYVHTYSLIHDDLPAMDDDDMRRGQPSVHKKFDEATAILAGDALLTLSFEMLADPGTHKDAEIRCALAARLGQSIGALGMVGGQMVDLKAENEDLHLDEIKRMQHMKTGALIVFSCEAGAILAKVEDERKEALVGYARDIGLAFQIVDDLLDVEGCSTQIGKTAGKDAQAGKATLVSLMGVNDAREVAKQLVESSIDRLKVFGKEADILRSLAVFVLDRAH